MSLDDPEVVRAQYATEHGLEARRSIWSMITEADKAERVPDDVGPVRAGTRVTVFVATTPGL